MATRYYQLTADELKLEREKQLEIVRASTADDYLDEYHKLHVMESLIAWHAAEAYRSGGVKGKPVQAKAKKAPHKPKVSPRKQAGAFEFGKGRRVSAQQPSVDERKRSNSK